MDLLVPISYLTLAVTILSFSAGVSICQKIKRKGSSSDFSVAPFLAGLLSTFLWLRYALFIQDKIGIVVNTIGAVTFLIYTLFYYYYTLNKSSVNKKFAILIALIIALVLVCNARPDPVYFSGIIASAASLGFASSPAVTIVDVFKTKSTEKLPFSFILSSFVVSSLWFVYGILVNDPFVQVPNGIITLISGLQLSLFAIFPSKRKFEGGDSTILLDNYEKANIDL
ncbi:sugar transporter SWEET1-like [Brevipalpus obovatus]|uniref:sugar transporter SWEET1-like n=1 Tax=Brevipalpus obovatus TaxID=246614 RepID=UPI003D9E763C